MSKQLIFSLLFLISCASKADDACVLQTKTVGRHKPIEIAERSQIKRTIIPIGQNNRKCLVDFRARIDTEWHSAFGEFEWDGNRPMDQACALALAQAEKDLLQRISSSQIQHEQVVICSDSSRHQTLRENSIGTVAELSQYRPHPNYTKEFYHNGTRCRWFQDVQWTGSKIWNYQGIICQVNQNSWVVVDKF